MTSSIAWQLHGCYQGNASYQYLDMPFDRIRKGCLDDSQSLDHFDTASPSFLFLKHLYRLRLDYPVLQDGMRLDMLSKQTEIIRVLSNEYITNYTIAGLWSVVRGLLPDQNLENKQLADQVWLLYSNLNQSKTWSGECQLSNSIRSPFAPGTIVKNIFPPFETYAVSGVAQSACLASLTLPPYGFKGLVDVNKWVASVPQLVHFGPGHDARILRDASVNSGSMAFSVTVSFSEPMDCNSITASWVSESGNLKAGSINCFGQTLDLGVSVIPGQFTWTAVLENVQDGVHYLYIGKGSRSLQGNRMIDASFCTLVYIFRLARDS